MTKTKDTEPKRCDECKWWVDIGRVDFGACSHYDIEKMAVEFFPSVDFYCKYWEEKEQK